MIQLLDVQDKLSSISKTNNRTSNKLEEMVNFSFVTIDKEYHSEVLNAFEFALVDDVYVPLNIVDIDKNTLYLGDLKKVSNGHKTSLCTYYRWNEDYKLHMKQHYHPHKETFVVTKGRLDFIINGRTFIIKESKSFEIDPYVPHTTIVYPNTTCNIDWFYIK